MQSEISVIVPLYNEQSVFPKLIERLDQLTASLSISLEFVLVDDGSTDNTPLLMQALAMGNSSYTCVFLSRNYGHQIAVSAGMQSASGTDAVMIIDGDLQDPPELLSAFYAKLKEGYDVVYAVRKKRKEGAIKRIAYWTFYRLLKSISEIHIPLDSGDFCMMTRRVNDIIVSMPEQSRFIRGMRTWVGFKQFGFEYERDKRASGEPKYTFKALFKLAYDGIFNFSYVPLRVITKLGVYSIGLSVIYLFYVLYKKIMGFPLPSGFTALIFAIILFSGVQLICLGIIGEYLARIYMQVKNRPLFIIKNKIVAKEEKNG
jgi:glycosyltransferase involved in cell wall biosynthesis